MGHGNDTTRGTGCYNALGAYHGPAEDFDLYVYEVKKQLNFMVQTLGRDASSPNVQDNAVAAVLSQHPHWRGVHDPLHRWPL